MGDVIIDGLTGANRLVILDANGKIPALDGSAVTNVAGANFSTGTIPVARLDTGTTAGKIVKLDGTAKLPAVSGAALTGIAGATKNASDPTISTNPSGGVGTEWHNTTSGEVYVCTDATAGENVWKNVGEQSGDIQLEFAGQTYGYKMGGRNGGTMHDAIEKYSFTSDGNATAVANLSVARDVAAGTQSKTYGFVSGGDNPTGHLMIDKHQFATTNDSTSVGNLLNKGYLGGGVSGNDDYGYHVGGDEPVDVFIFRFSFTSDGDATDAGDMTRGTNNHCCASDWSASYGYSAGGVLPTGDVIERFAFGSSVTSTDVGDMAVDVDAAAGISSETHGYSSGGYLGGVLNHIQKYAFAASGNSTDIANLTQARYGVRSGTSSPTHGYAAGGNFTTGVNYTDTIDKHSTVSDADSTDVGNLLVITTYPCGVHV
jgi:hypothetical protein